MEPLFENTGWLETIIRAAVKETISAHGPITMNLIRSAAKRIAGGIRGGLKREFPHADGHSACRLRVADLEERLAALKTSFDAQMDFVRREGQRASRGSTSAR